MNEQDESATDQDQIGRAYSILPPEDFDEAVCQHHGEMESLALHIKYDDVIWHPRQPYKLFVCVDCLSGLSRLVEEQDGLELSLKKVLIMFVIRDWDSDMASDVDVRGETEFTSGMRQFFEPCTSSCPYNITAQEGLLAARANPGDSCTR